MTTLGNDGKRKMLERLETALRLREEAEDAMRRAKISHEIILSRVTIETIKSDDAVISLPVSATVNSMLASLDDRCMHAFEAYLDAQRAYTHANDTVMLVDAEIRLHMED